MYHVGFDGKTVLAMHMHKSCILYTVIEGGKCLNVTLERTLGIMTRIRTAGMATEKVAVIQKMILVTTKAGIGDAVRACVVRRVKKIAETIRRENHMTSHTTSHVANHMTSHTTSHIASHVANHMTSHVADHTILKTRHTVIGFQQATEGVVPVPITTNFIFDLNLRTL